MFISRHVHCDPSPPSPSSQSPCQPSARWVPPSSSCQWESSRSPYCQHCRRQSRVTSLGKGLWVRDWAFTEIFPLWELYLITWNLGKTCPQIISLKFPKDETLDIFELGWLLDSSLEGKVASHLVQTSSTAGLYHSAVDLPVCHLHVLLCGQGESQQGRQQEYPQCHVGSNWWLYWDVEATRHSKALISLLSLKY